MDLLCRPALLTSAWMAPVNSAMGKAACSGLVLAEMARYLVEPEVSDRLAAGPTRQRQCALECSRYGLCIFRLDYGICLGFRCRRSFRLRHRLHLAELMDQARGGRHSSLESVLGHRRRHARDHLGPKFRTVIEGDVRQPTSRRSRKREEMERLVNWKLRNEFRSALFGLSEICGEFWFNKFALNIFTS